MNGSTETGAARLALYHETWAEIARLRDYEWCITYYFVTLAEQPLLPPQWKGKRVRDVVQTPLAAGDSRS